MDFENTAEFSREYQAGQNCLCDEEHMFSCPKGHSRAVDQIPEDVMEFGQALSQLIENAVRLSMKNQFLGYFTSVFLM